MSETKPKLTARQRRFVAEYLISLNATEAAKKAGYSAKSARNQGSQNYAKLYIREAIDEALRVVLSNRQQTLKNKFVREIEKMAFSDIRDNVTMRALDMLAKYLKLYDDTDKSMIGNVKFVFETSKEG